MTPIGRYVEITAPPTEHKSAGGILIANAEGNHSKATVLAVPDSVDEVEKGNKVMYNTGGAIQKGEKWYVHVDQIVGII